MKSTRFVNGWGGRVLHAASSRWGQQGAALLAAMLTVTLVATLTAASLWQQWRAVEVETAERSRVQAAWVLTGALDWSRLILREDARSGGADHLAEPWAIPLQEARLSSFLAADRDNNAAADDSDATAQAFLSGQISDLQARLNAMSLLDGKAISPPDLQSFARLFNLLGLPPNELNTLAENLRFAADTSPDNQSGGQASLLPQSLEQLRWMGLSATSVALLAPYVTVLPTRTPLNLNTASAQAIYASLPGLELADAQRLVRAREQSHFRSLEDAAVQLGSAADAAKQGRHSVASQYFEVRGRLRLDALALEERSVVQRIGIEVRTLSRQRDSLGQPALAATDAVAR
ncbi:MAG: type II secretion system minor pseudopilin GspK [Burkholderiales bacterium]|mgnify:CR=1 FL=1